MTISNFAALTGAIGRELNDFGGLRETRLLSTTAAGSSTLVVEHSYDWPAPSGKIAIDGVTYYYTGNDLNGTLSGIYVLVGGVQINNTQVTHNINDTVIDVSQTASALDQVREALLVGYASGTDLNAIGSNLGVPRAPTIKSDNQYRAIIEAMAYNPQATLYGITLVLNAIVGSSTITGATGTTSGSIVLTSVPTGTAVGQAVSGTEIPAGTTIISVYGTSANMSAAATATGTATLSYTGPNWAISEDLINYPCQITVTIPSNIFLNTVPQGQAYLTGPTSLTASAGVLPNYQASTGQTFVRASGIVLTPIMLVTNCRAALPSADGQPFYAGGPTVATWSYASSISETTAVQPYFVNSVQVGYRIDNTTTSGNQTGYYQNLPVMPGSEASLSIVAMFETALFTSSGTIYTFLQINDGAYTVLAYVCLTGTVWTIGISANSASTSLASYVINVNQLTTFNEFRLHRRKDKVTELLFNNVVVCSVPYSALTVVASTHNVEFGQTGARYGGIIFKQVMTYASTATDYWNATGTNGSVSTASPTTLTATGMALTSADVGKQLRVTANPTFVATVTTSASGNTLTGAPSSGIVVGMGILAVNIPSGTKVVGVSGTTITMSNLASSTATIPVTFTQLTNAQGGNNNCVMQVQSGSTTSAALLNTGSLTGAQLVGSTTTQRVIINTPTGATNAFTYPDDLGKVLTIENSQLGQSGSYVIVRLYDAVTGLNLATEYATTVTVQTNTCDVQVAGNPSEPVFVPESNLNYDISPAFVTETGLSWELSDAGTVTAASGNQYTITPRQALPISTATYDVTIDNVPSAQVLTNAQVQNNYVSAGPPAVYTYWPFYVTDPYNVVETYLNLIVAAGIQINFNFT